MEDASAMEEVWQVDKCGGREVVLGMLLLGEVLLSPLPERGFRESRRCWVGPSYNCVGSLSFERNPKDAVNVLIEVLVLETCLDLVDFVVGSKLQLVSPTQLYSRGGCLYIDCPMEEMFMFGAGSSASFSGAKLICLVCQKQYSQYTCPRCNTQYCSLECYKRHSLCCTESFMRDNVVNDLHQIQSNDETKRKMLEILKRVHSEYDVNSGGEEGNAYDVNHDDEGKVFSLSGLPLDDDDKDEDEDDKEENEEKEEVVEEEEEEEEEEGGDLVLSEETVQKILADNELTLEDLSFDEAKKFKRAVASGELSKLILPWEPWWKRPSAASISLGPRGNQLIQPLCVEGADEPSSNSMEASISEIPTGPESPLPPLQQLSRVNPSPLLAIHLIDVIYSYCFILRLYNGDWHFDPVGATTVVLTTSSVLSNVGRPETVSQALASCLEQTCSPAFRHFGGFKLGLILIDDIIQILSLGVNCIICLLCDLRRLVLAGEDSLMSEKIEKLTRTERSRKLNGVEKKVYFLMCWVHEQPEETWSSLASLVEVEKASLSTLSQHGGGKHTVDRIGGSKERVFIEEV
ncbi:hypothetical protein HPP92_022011 [Vanilla planifolia]|uniref:HIT-type domain-containing protein n=1 Tax=Vanilla planifolia TaxID=51239 RepID=A0A835PXE2_VANPL|nr:hypothetical protein HPP92_022011 [Vanilla planifolia]